MGTGCCAEQMKSRKYARRSDYRNSEERRHSPTLRVPAPRSLMTGTRRDADDSSPRTKVGRPGSVIWLGNGLFGGFQGHRGNRRLCHFCKTWNPVVQVPA
jgi:hypothetical protein